ncbi:alpha-tocopherol transfer protein-like [Hetaerina americana]|uniref:alpha-tocopherol transfer protein-like n=1 Tax=Hetaerina americana TaxID=62018 RepID=UPI003A7F1A0B
MSQYTEFTALTEEDEYEWTLGEELAEIAKKELREDESVRNQSLRQMRDWIRKNPRIASCRMDARFLLRFLRFKKFSVPMAQEALERYILLRNVYAQAFENLDPLEPVVDELISNGYTVVAPKRDEKGQRVIFYFPGKFDPYKYTNADMCRVHGVVSETLMEDEENQIRGYVHWGDGKGVGFPHLTLFTPREAVRIAKNGEATVPMRHKEIHALNIHPSLKFAIDFGMSLAPEKIKGRIKMYTSLEEAKGSVDPELLPKEYGGVMPMEEMTALWKKEMLEMRSTLLLHDKMKVREGLFSESAREGAVRALKTGGLEISCALGSDPTSGITGSFRKLEVD